MTIKLEINEKTIAKFHANISHEKDCWLWTGSERSSGYGAIALGGSIESSHRFAYEYLVGPIPKHMWVLHRCDAPKCCNPKHLFLGTPRDNAIDMQSKGRKAKVTWLGGKKKHLPPNMLGMLGKIPDVEISRLVCLNVKTVARIRVEMGIQALPNDSARRRKKKLDARFLGWLGVRRDADVAQESGIGIQSIRKIRKELGICSFRAKTNE